jgi:hypothetical protein
MAAVYLGRHAALRRGFGLPCFSSLLAAAAFWSARFTAADFFPGFGLQLPFSPGAFPATGSNPGQHRELRFALEDFLEEGKVVFEEVFRADFFAVVIVLWTQWFDAPILRKRRFVSTPSQLSTQLFMANETRLTDHRGNSA